MPSSRGSASNAVFNLNPSRSFSGSSMPKPTLSMTAGNRLAPSVVSRNAVWAGSTTSSHPSLTRYLPRRAGSDETAMDSLPLANTAAGQSTAPEGSTSENAERRDWGVVEGADASESISIEKLPRFIRHNRFERRPGPFMQIIGDLQRRLPVDRRFGLPNDIQIKETFHAVRRGTEQSIRQHKTRSIVIHIFDPAYEIYVLFRQAINLQISTLEIILNSDTRQGNHDLVDVPNANPIDAARLSYFSVRFQRSRDAGLKFLPSAFLGFERS